MRSLFLISAALCALGAALESDDGPAPTVDARAALELLQSRCFSCHDAEKQQGDLRLDLRELALAERGGWPRAIVPGASEESEVIRRVLVRDGDEMPPEGELLTEAEVELLARWIDAGAPWVELEATPSFPLEGVPEARVRELLTGRCLSCHGEARQRGGLRLDRRDAALARLESGRTAIVPGASGESEVLRRVRAEDDEDRMPAVGEPLSEAEVALLERWIEGGAPWPSGMETRHWAYVPPVRPPLPDVEDEVWVRGPIDRFVLARLESEGLAPAPEADRPTLLRRLSLDLVGLPPTEEELAAFVADDRPDAYERQVDRLLASPHFGERWGRHWLDLARYSDSNGYSRDFERTIWPYRDWVVNALNADMPFDRFSVEQLAGDLLPEPTRDQLVATGFHRNTLVQNEGGADDEEFRVEAVKNRVETTGTVWLGSTLNCAQCHDHKYDPFAQREYYELFAFFNGTADRGRSTEPKLELPTPEEARRLEEVDRELAALDARLLTLTPELREARDDWEANYSGGGSWAYARIERASSTGGLELEPQEDGSVRPVGPTPKAAVYSLRLRAPFERVTGLRLEALMDPDERAVGPGLGPDGNFVLTELAVREAVEDGALPEPHAVRRVTTSFAHHRGPGEDVLDRDPATGWAVSTRTMLSHELVVTFAEPLEPEGDPAGEVVLDVDLEQDLGEGLLLGRFRLSVTDVDEPPRAAVVPWELVEELLAIAPDARKPEQQQRLDRVFLSVTPLLDDLRRERERVAARRPEPATTLVMRELGEPRPTHLLERGSFLAPGEPVEPDVPGFLSPLRATDGRPTRLDLARWLVDGRNPLTARVQVNRWWQRLFGRGLVGTENDFGTRGDDPTHPALLDWLAVELVQDGWSLKRALRRIVTSATYRQSSAPRPELAERDPRNRLLARQNRLRLEGEVIRDSALRASGRLVPTLGGPPVHPPAPGFDSILAAGKDWPESTGDDRYRRTLYTRHWRNSPYPFVETFDGPGANDACTRRGTSNTPLQALVMANDAMVYELAGALAERVLASAVPGEAASEAPGDGTADDLRLTRAFTWCLGRPPEPAEADVLRALLADERAAGADEALAWTAVARVLFNLDEFVTRD